MIKPKEKAREWLQAPFDEKTQQKTQALIEADNDELAEAFYTDLAFGTGGMRGIMGVGTNRINPYTLGKNTQGVANYLHQQFPDKDEIRVAIAYDCRHKSQSLADVVAEVFSANNIKVKLFPALRPTPLLSYTVKYLNCQCGIVLTASHNPPEYNGYKVYWADGGQLVPPQDHEIIKEINALKFADINFDKKTEYIDVLDETVDQAFIKDSIDNASFQLNDNNDNRSRLNIVFTSLHGTSITLNPKVLEQAGYTNLHIVEEQAEPDGGFPTVKSPNPEEPEALKMALELADKKNADIVIGTDPDCDRLGIAVRNNDGEMMILNGNQAMVLMTWFLLDQHKSFQGHEYIASTIVSTPMMKSLAEIYKVDYHETLTGFKWIADLIKRYPDRHFIGGGEESFGFMVGDFVRDKDATTSTLLICELAAYLKADGSSLYEKLIELYQEAGFYQEKLVALVKKGIKGAEEIKEKMNALREEPLKEIDGEPVTHLEDYQKQISYNLKENTKSEINLPQSNVLIYKTASETKVCARPSGTEPKIKFYISVNDQLENKDEFEMLKNQLDDKIQRITSELGIT
ncbi:MAG: phospho-sugar mutase [Psychroflexus sp.]|nr:phospho-sugar mutase [Psychroflexus sp.]MDR9448825.1 phospho-sugar mutase [Psychroflexus sp.]